MGPVIWVICSHNINVFLTRPLELNGAVVVVLGVVVGRCSRCSKSQGDLVDELLSVSMEVDASKWFGQ